MAIQINSLNDLRTYFAGVVHRAECHAPDVVGVLFPLLGAFIHYHNPNETVKVRQYNNNTANIIWFYVKNKHVNAKKVAIVYNHHTGEIDIRDRTLNGTINLSVTDQTPPLDIYNFFENLS